MRNFKFTVVFERDEDGRYVAICPVLPGCYSEGRTQQEATEMIRDAIRLHIEDHLERGEPIGDEVGTSMVEVAV